VLVTDNIKLYTRHSIFFTIYKRKTFLYLTRSTAIHNILLFTFCRKQNRKFWRSDFREAWISKKSYDSNINILYRSIFEQFTG